MRANLNCESASDVAVPSQSDAAPPWVRPASVDHSLQLRHARLSAACDLEGAKGHVSLRIHVACRPLQRRIQLLGRLWRLV